MVEASTDLNRFGTEIEPGGSIEGKTN